MSMAGLISTRTTSLINLLYSSPIPQSSRSLLMISLLSSVVTKCCAATSYPAPRQLPLSGLINTSSSSRADTRMTSTIALTISNGFNSGMVVSLKKLLWSLPHPSKSAPSSSCSRRQALREQNWKTCLASCFICRLWISNKDLDLTKFKIRLCENNIWQWSRPRRG